LLHTSRIPPGFIGLDQYNLIVDLAQSLPQGSSVLEIGSGFGRSTHAWLSGLKDSTMEILDDWEWHNIHNGLYEKMKPFEINEQDWNSIKEINNHFKSWKHFVSQHPNFDYIKKIHSTTTELYRNKMLTNKFDCVYLDDSHNPDDVTESLNYFSQSPILCGDDYNSSWPELSTAIKNYAVKSNKNLTVHSCGFWTIK